MNLDTLDEDFKDGVRGIMEEIGKDFKLKVKDKILTVDIPPALAPSTIARKGHDKTLVDTYALSESLDSEMESDETVKIGIINYPVVAGYGEINELGLGKTPQRSFLNSTLTEEEESIINKIKLGIKAL